MTTHFEQLDECGFEIRRIKMAIEALEPYRHDPAALLRIYTFLLRHFGLRFAWLQWPNHFSRWDKYSGIN